ncbi:hypothetical protein LTR62_005441 [Meristemomyces frigidus]|uniref:Uncharacterized protein n=1 Tax=Meristemomyces frigidus TaxID=1508187 RepID=A0AAN7TFC1_9PEZI|nr:hypothetical protein LTR62_005441 [Meristemomyces frigidus]
MSTLDPSSSPKPSPTANVKPSRLPAPTLFIGPPSRNASQLSVSRQGLAPTTSKTRDPLTRQRIALGRSGDTKTSTELPTIKKASEKEAEAKWKEMQSTLDEVELTAQTSTHVFGESHAAALEELRRAQIELARAWGRGNEEKEGSVSNEGRFNGADDIANDRRATHGTRARGDTESSASTVLSDESVLTGSPTSAATGGGGAGARSSQLEDETAEDIKRASERRAANEAYFKKVERGVKDVVGRLEVVAAAMRGVEGESRSLWGGSSKGSGESVRNEKEQRCEE